MCSIGRFGLIREILEKTRLGFQRFEVLPLRRWVSLPHSTKLEVKAFPLNHGNGYPSTAFLLKHKKIIFSFW
ncbi:hypothetical protein [Coxiella endosymbiont of Ornithodoros amblus]|uniref:hypothetical protein n=1 Tax=Coxiella endosymbiont of Ornithodoros amblus TaxID=1656166 RepID=UPI00244DD0E4|nr:hypothetical protein [Coxiella endosymbiont of Ornithodoros amblus]